MRRNRLALVLLAVAACGGGGSMPGAPHAGPSGTPGPVPTDGAPTPPTPPTPDPVAQWQASGPEAGQAWAVAVDAGDPDAVYAGTQRGAYASADAGERWTFVGGGMLVAERADTVIELQSDPARPGVLYALTSARDSGAPRLWKSTDGGESWASLEPGPRNGDATRAGLSILSVAPSMPDTLLAAGSGLHVSLDGGATWAMLLDTYVAAVAVDPRDARRILVGGSRMALLSEDGGATWIDLGAPFDEARPLGRSETTAFAFAPSDPRIAYAGLSDGRIVRSDDGGQTWTLRPTYASSNSVNVIAVSPRDPEVVHVATGGRYWRSTDGGGSWQDRTAAIAPWGQVLDIAIDERRAERVLMASPGAGVLRSDDDGESFARLRNGLGPARVRTVAVDPSSPATVLAGSLDGFFRSDDGGRSWTDASRETGFGSVSALAFDPSSPGAVVASAGNTVAVSQDAGRSWSSTFASTHSVFGGGPITQPPFGLGIGIEDPTVVVAAHGLASLSVDGGTSFERLYIPPRPGKNVLPDEICASFTAVAIAPGSPSTLYLHAGDQVIRSTDEARSWNPELRCPSWSAYAQPPGFPTGIVVQPATQGLVYATSASGVLRSDDGGVSWRVVGDDALGWVYALALDPRDPDAIYAGTRERGVFRSRDRGITWQIVGEHFGGRPVVALAVDPVGGARVHAAVEDVGVATLDIPE